MIDVRQRRLALLVAACYFIEILDGTIVTTSAPRIAAALHVSISTVGLVVTAYLVTLAVLIPLSGWTVTRFGTRTVFLAAIAIFTVASLGCATSINLAELVMMRVLQGVGGAMMVPVGRLAVLGNAAKADIMRLVSFIVWPALVAPVIAPLAGGIITTYAGWRWLFVINLPLGVIAFVVASRIVVGAPTSAPPPLDWRGVLLTVVGLGGLTCLASLISEPSPDWPLVLTVGLVAFLALIATARHLRLTKHPLIDLATLRIGTFRSSVGAGALFYLAISSVPFLLPLMFENAFGWSAIKSGAIVLCLFAGNIGIKPVVNRLVYQIGFRTVLATTTTALGATMICLGLVTRHTPLAVIIVIAILSGMFRSIGGTSYNTLLYSDVPTHQMRHANSLATTVNQLSLGFGVAAATVALRIGAVFTDSAPYTVAFVILAVLPLGAAGLALILRPDAGAAVRAR